VSLKEEWARTAVQATGMQVKEEISKTKANKKRKASKKDTSSGVNVNGRSSLGGNSVAMLEICSWSKVPAAIESTVDSYVVVADEAHMIQSMEAARTQNFLTLVAANRCVGVLLLTGTPMKNGKPSNLFPLLRACRHPFGRHQRAYETHFCAGREIRTSQGRVWVATGGTNLAQLGELVSSHLLYLKKEECLRSLPELTREFRHVPVSYHAQKSYDAQMKEVVSRVQAFAPGIHRSGSFAITTTLTAAIRLNPAGVVRRAHCKRVGQPGRPYGCDHHPSLCRSFCQNRCFR
jgi:SNF2-related domain